MILINGCLAVFHTDLHGLLSKPFEFVKRFDRFLARDHCNHVVDSFVVGRWCSRNSRHQNSFINPILLVALTENIDGATNIFAGDFVNMYILLAVLAVR